EYSGLSNAGAALMGIGEASGENATVDAVKAAIDSPLLETSLQGARGVLLNIMGATESLSMLEVNEASTTVQEAAHPDAEIIWGVSVDETLGDKVSVTVIATRFDDEEEEEPLIEREPVKPAFTETPQRQSPFGSFNPTFSNTTSQWGNDIEIPDWMRTRK
ncbi:MAG: cell division protein FtsZ, partial [Selenomonadaceae bacterium]|nr:cell division protein FtsZ [Selenomonadaceae bacterium]